jgi:phosphate transport system protein
MMERPIDIQLEKLKVKLIKMCSLVDEQVEYAIKAVDENNNEIANIVEERDARVDKYDNKIEKVCHKIFALNQPVAMDLRLIISSLKINSNLERIGDLAVNIARNARDLSSKPGFFPKLHFSEIAYIARDMINKAIDSFIGSDVELAGSVIETDDKLDSLVKEDTNTLIQIMKDDPENVATALIFYSINEELERIGDHAVNIGREVYFIVNARSMKHRNEIDEE